jgi:polyhydroxybutyrate depolymerase
MTKTLFLLVTFFILGCNKEDGNSSMPNPTVIPYQDGLTTNYITVNNVIRKYLVYRPTGMTTANVVITVLHGGGGLGLDVAKLGTHPLSVFRTIADNEKFLVVYPEGSLDVQGNPGWNDCRSDDISGSQGDDITFLKNLNAKLVSELNITSSKMFLTGTSNGALMTYSYAFQFPETLKAIAVSSGNLPQFPASGMCTNGSTFPIPILLTHGTSDPAMPANGGCVANLGGACNRGKVISQAETITYWLQRNGLQSVTPTVTTLDVNTTDSGNVEKRVYNGAKPLVYLILNNAGHSVASKTIYLDSSPANGVQNRDIEYAEEVWNFFKGLQ